MKLTKATILALACVSLAAGASAETFVSGVINSDTTWCDGTNTGPIILEEPVFVVDAELTILSPCVVRGQPRQDTPANAPLGAPGALVITNTGKINAVGTPTSPIVFTTAAVDNNGDGVPDDDDANLFLDEYVSGDTFYDDAPLTAPLAPLNTAGQGNISLWGGMVILGNAPTNLGDNFAGLDHGQGLVEGVSVPAFPASQSAYGGVDPHDNSGSLVYASIRHAGDELGEGNELNCLTLAGVGDGTKISFVECYCNFDDGFEWFGGTVDTDHLVAVAIGDDTFDLDQGFTGIGQFWFGVMPTFNNNDGSTYGSRSGDKGGEWDGDDYLFDPDNANLHRLNTRLSVPNDGGAPVIENTPWPLSNPAVWNMTLIGSTPDVANPATSPNSANRGVQMRNGFAGKMYNSIIVNTGTAEGLDVTDGDGGAPGFDACTDNVGAGLIAVVSTTFDDTPAMGTCETTALSNGNAIGASNNNVGVIGQALASENNAIDPDGGGDGKLDPVSPAMNPDPGLVGTATPVAGPGLEPVAYRGAFEPGAANWTTDWTVLNISGVLVD